MIPKKIHYCWFGRKPLPRKYKNYIKSWKKFFPGYEIIRWDESNFDINEFSFTEKAYIDGKMAFVSDYARLKILYEHGGVYFDTDVEVIATMDDIISKGSYMGFEKNTNLSKGDTLYVNLGLGFAVEPQNKILKEALDIYDKLGYEKKKTIVVIITDILKKHGLRYCDKPVIVEGITIYPCEYFCPIEFLGNKIEITKNTRTIHHFTASWMTRGDKLKMLKGYYVNKIRKLLGRLK